MTIRHLLFLTLIPFLLASCSSSRRIIKYPKRPDDTYANSNLKLFLKSNKSPKVVLRVPNASDKATSNTSTSKSADIFYNAIEKEFLKQAFSVRDRGLFNEIINKAASSDYSKIKDLTDTDLILEVVNIDDKVVYTTNKVTVIGKRKESTELQEIDYKRNGASVEFTPHCSISSSNC